MKKNTTEEFKEELAAMGRRLRNIRMEVKLKLDEMADKIGISKSDLSEIEKGTKIIDFIFFLKFSLMFNVNLNYLILGVGEVFIQETNGVTEYDFNNEIATIGEFVWLMEKSTFFKYTMMGQASRLILENGEILEFSIKRAEKKKQALIKKKKIPDAGRKGGKPHDPQR